MHSSAYPKTKEYILNLLWILSGLSYSEVCITSVSAPFPPHKISLNRNSPGLESQRAHRTTCCCQSGIYHPYPVYDKRIRYLNSSDNSDNIDVLLNIIVSLSSFKLFYIPVQALPARVFSIQVNIVYSHLLYPGR